MRVIVNGEQREVNSASVDALLSELDYEGTHFAIALNYDVVPKSRWAETALKAGDEIEIITPRQGGGGDAERDRRFPSPLPASGARLRRAAAVFITSPSLPRRDDLDLVAALQRGLRPLASRQNVVIQRDRKMRTFVVEFAEQRIDAL